MPLKNRRGEYTWRPTSVGSIQLVTDKKAYASGDTVTANLSFKLVGGLRDAFHPDVWTVAWEDFDKILRLTLRVSIAAQRTPLNRKVSETKKHVRRASFYWSRDPDLPYRIWAMIVPEDGGPPIIPHSVEDAKTKMLDVEKSLSFPASSLGSGKQRLVGTVEAKWGRRTFIEKGSVTAKSKPAVIEVE